MAIAVAVLLVAPGDDDQPSSAASATPSSQPSASTTVAVSPSPTSSPDPSSTPAPTVTPPPIPAVAVRWAVWSVPAAAGQPAVLHESDVAALPGLIESDGLWLNFLDEPRHAVRFSFDGARLEERDETVFRDPGGPECTELGPRSVRIEGRQYSANCGVFSPDNSKMFYTVDRVPGGNSIPGSEYQPWVLDLATGNNVELNATLRHCGGCDGRAGPSWSPSGRFLLFGETYAGPDSSVYLYDSRTEAVRKVATGPSVNGLHQNPSWAPDVDAFLRPDGQGGTVYEFADGSRVLPLPGVRWVARFSGSPPFIISGGWFDDPVREVVVVERDGGAIVARWPGTLNAPVVSFDSPTAAWGVVRVDGKPAAVLEPPHACDGAILHHPSLAADRCLPGAQAPALSPDGSRVAFVRVRTSTVIDGWTTVEWEVVIHEVDTGREAVVPRPLKLHEQEVPLVRWVAGGTHVLVQSPRPGL